MKNLTKSMLVLSLFVIGLSSCSKEKKIERALIKKDGIWDVTSFHYKWYSYDSLSGESTTSDHPAFVFHKDGRFEWENGNITGTWLNTDDEIVITLDQPSMNNSNIYILKIIEESKDEMTLKRRRWYVDMGSWTQDATYQIKRRK